MIDFVAVVAHADGVHMMQIRVPAADRAFLVHEAGVDIMCNICTLLRKP